MGRKGDETYQKIVTAAVQSFAQFGDKGTTFQSIADLAGVSQPLVAKHFKSREAVLPAAIERFLSDTRSVTMEAIEKAETPLEKIQEYLRVSIRMFRNQPELFKIYLLLHYYAGFDDNYRKINTDIKNVAVERIRSFIELGMKDGSFKKCNSRVTAKIIHSSLVGVVLSISTESSGFTDAQLQKGLESMVLDFLVQG